LNLDRLILTGIKPWENLATYHYSLTKISSLAELEKKGNVAVLDIGVLSSSTRESITIDHTSERGIRRKEFSKLKLLKTYLRLSIQPAPLNSLVIMSIESEISRGLNLDKIVKDMVIMSIESEISRGLNLDKIVKVLMLKHEK